MKLGSPSTAGLADGLWSVFLTAPVPSGCTLTEVLSNETTSSLTFTIPLSLELFEYPVEYSPAVHPGVDGVPPTETLRQPTPLAAVLCDIQNGVEHLYVRDAYVATLHRQVGFYELVLSLCEFHTSTIPPTHLLV